MPTTARVASEKLRIVLECRRAFLDAVTSLEETNEESIALAARAYRAQIAPRSLLSFIEEAVTKMEVTPSAPAGVDSICIKCEQSHLDCTCPQRSNDV